MKNPPIPTHMFEVFPSGEPGKCCVGMNLGAMPLKRFRLAFETIYEFPGKTANVLIGCNAAGLSREDALRFAIAFMSGKIVTTAVDLDTLTATYS